MIIKARSRNSNKYIFYRLGTNILLYILALPLEVNLVDKLNSPPNVSFYFQNKNFLFAVCPLKIFTILFYIIIIAKIFKYVKNYFLKILLSIQKKIQPPIKLAIIVFHSVPIFKCCKQKYKIGLDNCHLTKYNKKAFIFTHNHSFFLFWREEKDSNLRTKLLRSTV